MSKRSKESQIKDLDPRAVAKNVKGGVCCLVFGPTRVATRVVENSQRKARELLDPR